MMDLSSIIFDIRVDLGIFVLFYLKGGHGASWRFLIP